MGRRLFLKHLEDARHLASAEIQDIRSPDEGIVTFSYIHPINPHEKFTIQACATDLSEYPDGNSFMLFAEDEQPIYPIIPRTLQRLTEHANGKTLVNLLSEVGKNLTAAISTKESLPDIFVDSPNEQEQNDDNFEFDFDEDLDDEVFGLATLPSKPHLPAITHASRTVPPLNMEQIAKLRTDLQALKNAGFRVGVYDNLTSSGILCVSIRISKLGLSDEALEAWGISRHCYLALLINYCRGYRDATQVSDESGLKNLVQMRVGLCPQYKPAAHHARAAFQQSISGDVTTKAQASSPAEIPNPFEPLSIGKALNQFLEERLFKIISARHLYRLTWLGAETFISDRQAAASTADFLDMTLYDCDDATNAKHLPPVVLGDHMAQASTASLSQASLPLIIMQFVLRHVVRCTEFCLVCHSRVDDSFEALKAYVCLKPLCLFQYLALGFGPSLEWEIRTQPYVVDLLISFCYAAASASRLKELPVGMNLKVPIFSRLGGAPNHRYAGVQQPSSGTASQRSFASRWYVETNYLIVEEVENPLPENCLKVNTENATAKTVKAGDWICLISRGLMAHARVEKVELPVITLNQPISVPKQGEDVAGDSKVPEIETGVAVDCYLYDKNFDEISLWEQNDAIMRLLDTLPGVLDMRAYLERQGWSQGTSLKTWSNRISDSALNLLRWIVASNRSCILQVDKIGGVEATLFPGRPEDRVGAMEGWMQFRFAQGAPDKEKRFNECVEEQARITGTKFPTLFAWHGSRLGNWHSIIRQGLHYDEVLNGRACGNGIYMSSDASTSLGYSSIAYQNAGTCGWTHSVLKIHNVLSLQEVVNNAQKFVSSAPHYVVGDIEWVQTRYLFIKTKELPELQDQVATSYQQDPQRLVFNEKRSPIAIPLTAISRTHRYGGAHISPSPTSKRTKTTHMTPATIERFEDDAESVISEAKDFEFLQEPANNSDLQEPVFTPGKKRSAESVPETDFVAGRLDLVGITFMQEPEDATPMATKALMRLLNEAIKTQESTVPASLGWFINRNLINNMYQWVVELHSFPKELPLAMDMKAAGIPSIVMEMRFSGQFPFCAPFLRVIKPRFKPFNQGGGGNVTEGGAMCMEVLTSNGWSAALTIESLLLQVRLSLLDTERPARLAVGRDGDQSTYGIGEAIAAYLRACTAHGWTVPAGFNSIVNGQKGSGEQSETRSTEDIA